MLEKELSLCLIACQEASEAILEIYSSAFEVETKEDDSPVTAADRASQEIIFSHLKPAFPEDGFLSEESTDDLDRLNRKRVWIIDPLDGTKEFVKRNGEFAINIALAIEGEVVLGVICSPVLRKTYYAVKGAGAFVIENGERRRIRTSDRKKGELIPFCSRSDRHNDAQAFALANPSIFACPCIPLGSSLKMAFVAEGKGDYFLRLYEGTKEWDVASGDIILREAGGIMVDGTTMEPFIYNRRDVVNRKGYVMASHRRYLFLKQALAFLAK